MGGTAMTTKAELDFSDVQGLVRFGFGHLKHARYDLLEIVDPVEARAWLRSAPVTSAETTESKPRNALQIAFTEPGLRQLGIAESTLEQFSHEFRSGMPTEYRARQLGDLGDNAAANWKWGGPDDRLHLLVIFFGKKKRFDEFVAQVKGERYDRAFKARTLRAAKLTTDEPFGFADGISQPKIDWRQERRTPTTQMEYTNLTALGEFLLGHPNEYGKLTDRPLLEPGPRTAGLLPAPEAPEMKDLGMNGTYLVMRQLEQDVPGFWRFVHDESGGDGEEAERLAAAMVGRRRDGTPLVAPRDRPIPGGGGRNQFTFEGDPDGTRCPFGAHVRRANPRNFDYPRRPPTILHKLLVALGFGPRRFRYDAMSSVRFHRILRRGRGYGPTLKPEKALTAPDGERRGLFFICLNANIQRQFEFVQNAWMASGKFAAMTGENDPLIGHRQPQAGCPAAADFNLPRAAGVPRRVTGLPQFVTTRGGAYFFLPSLRALRYLASDEAG